jgi:hypothetical protein
MPWAAAAGNSAHLHSALQVIAAALEEDAGDRGDITSLST